MEQHKFPVKLFGAVAIVASLTISACNNNDTNTVETTTDSPTVMTGQDTMITTPVPMGDTSTMMPTATDTSKMRGTGMAKPNAAKKGMKGKVSIVIPAAPKTKADAQPNASGVYANVDYIPSFPGGNAGLQKFFDDNIQYPSSAQDNGVEGTVRIAFTVDENGRLMSPKVEGDKEGYGLDEEALRVINKMPVWNPGKINGKPVKTSFVLPVKFALNSY